MYKWKLFKPFKQYLKSIYVKVRNFYIYRTKKIILLEKENRIIRDIKSLFFIQLLSFLNFNFLINYLGYNYMYVIDNIFFYKHTQYIYSNLSIQKIDKCIINLNNNILIDFTENIQKYNLNVPLYLIVNNEKLEDILKENMNNIIFDFEIDELFRTKTKKYEYSKIKYKRIYEIILS